MKNLVDLTEFRLITQGKKHIERLLFDDFISISETNLLTMAQAIKAKDRELWRENAHMMKGACRNLGAFILADKLEAAEKCTAEEQAVRYEEIASAFADVRDFLEKEASR
jgi:HPt (histidine-containing phosphotransfer) domain-containing protein